MCTSCDNIQATTTPDASTDATSAGIHEVSVQGMTCTGCASKVSAAVEQVSGVTGTEVDLAAGTVRVRGEGVDRYAVRSAITGIGYRVN